MKKITRAGIAIGGIAVGLLGAAVGFAQTQKLQQPEWAYAVTLEPAAPFSDDGTKYTVSDSTASFNRTQIAGRDQVNGIADWDPADHPAMPRIVSHGDPGARAIAACGLCHYANGKGRGENAGVSGLSKDYIVQTLHDMATGARKSSEPLKANAIRMDGFAKNMTEEEITAAANYFSAIPWTPWIKVVESTTAPKVRSNAGLYVPVTGPGAGMEPLGDRIIEVPVDPQHTEFLRDPHSPFIAYVPVGSVAKGKAIVTTGMDGKTLACSTCHGADLNGVGAIPAIAARSPSYVARQLNDFQQGTRNGAMAALMKPVVAKLTTEDILDISAYLASLPAPATSMKVAGR